MREKVAGNAVCQVRTSQACHGPRDYQIKHKDEKGKARLDFFWASCLDVLLSFVTFLFALTSFVVSQMSRTEIISATCRRSRGPRL